MLPDISAVMFPDYRWRVFPHTLTVGQSVFHGVSSDVVGTVSSGVPVIQSVT